VNASIETVERVRDVVVRVLGIEDRASQIDATTPLFGSIPELDSMAVLELATVLEQEFGIVIDDDDFTGEVFETVGSLAAFVEQRAAA
jgi:acyl carrier protein